MKNVDELPERIIEVYKITTPKCGYFVFWATKNDRLSLEVEPFVLKEADKYYPYKHHIRGDDLLYFRTFAPDIILYDKRFKAQTWEDAMKWEIYHVIEKGLLNRKAKINGEDVFLKFVWTGDKVMKSRIDYKGQYTFRLVVEETFASESYGVLMNN